MKPKDHHYFENWARRMGMKPYLKVTDDKFGDLLSASSIYLIDRPPRGTEHAKFYRTGFCLYRDKAWIASSDVYGPEEFPLYTLRGKQELRINEALKYARKYFAQFEEHKLFNPHETRKFRELLH